MLWYLCWKINGQTHQSQPTLSPMELDELVKALETDTQVEMVWWECPFANTVANVA